MCNLSVFINKCLNKSLFSKLTKAICFRIKLRFVTDKKVRNLKHKYDKKKEEFTPKSPIICVAA